MEEPLGRPRHRWEDNIKMYVKQGVREWTGLSGSGRVQWQALVNIVMNLLVP